MPSRVAAQMVEAMEATPRKPMTAARKTRIWQACDGKCAWCGQDVPESGPEVRYDHRLPLALGGADDDDNIRPLHTRPCDAQKTAFDWKRISKALRIQRKLKGQQPRKQAIRSRGFRKDPLRMP